MAAGAVRGKCRASLGVQDRFRHDRARRVAGTEKQNVVAVQASAARSFAATAPRLLRPDKGAHEFAFHLRSDCVDIDALLREKCPRVFDFVNACGFDLDGLKAGSRQLGGVLRILQRSCDAADP